MSQIFPACTREGKSRIASVSALSARFGRANQKREDQIAAILETLRGLGL